MFKKRVVNNIGTQWQVKGKNWVYSNIWIWIMLKTTTTNIVDHIADLLEKTSPNKEIDTFTWTSVISLKDQVKYFPKIKFNNISNKLNLCLITGQEIMIVGAILIKFVRPYQQLFWNLLLFNPWTQLQHYWVDLG